MYKGIFKFGTYLQGKPHSPLCLAFVYLVSECTSLHVHSKIAVMKLLVLLLNPYRVVGGLDFLIITWKEFTFNH